MATILSSFQPNTNASATTKITTVKAKKEASVQSETSSDSFEFNRHSANKKKTKFVARKIPLFVTEDEIKAHLKEFESSYNWFQFCSQPKISKNPTRRNKQNYNRFYINFDSFDDAIPFIDKFKKLTFEKTQNNDPQEIKPANINFAFNRRHEQNETFKLCVEFAPNQALPKIIASRDRRTNTIDTDKDYLRFLDNLKKSEVETEKIIQNAQESLIRTTMSLMNNKNESNAKDQNEEEKEQIIAPLAKHVAAQKNKRQIKKNLNRRNLIKSEQSNKEIKKKKKRTMKHYFANKKNPKYKRTYPKFQGDYDENESSQRGRGRGRSRGRGRGRGGRRWSKAKRKKSGSGSRQSSEEWSGWSKRGGQQTWRSKQGK